MEFKDKEHYSGDKCKQGCYAQAGRIKFEAIKMTHIEPRIAFDNAIANGTLCGRNNNSKNYAGKYMYMHSDKKGDHFKNINTRHYIISPLPFL